MKTKTSRWFSRFVLILSGVFLIVSPAFGASLPDLQKQQQQSSQNLQKLRKQESLTKQELQEQERILSQINRSISNTQGKIARTETQIVETQKEIDGFTLQINEKEQELAVEQENQNEAIRVLYETSGQSTLEVLIGSDTISSVISHSEYLEALEVRIEATIQEITRLKEELEAKKAEQERRRTELDTLRQQLVAQRAELQRQQREQRDLVNNTKSELASLREQIAQELALLQQIDSQIRQIVAKSFPGTGRRVSRGEAIGLMGNSGCSTGAHLHYEVYNSTGVPVDPRDYHPPLLWPFENFYPTYEHGEYTFYGVPHRGRDIVSTDGGVIRAAANGEIMVSVYNPGNTYDRATGRCSPVSYGSYLIIRYDNEYIARYAHLQ